MNQDRIKEAMKAAEKAMLESRSTDIIYGVRAGASPIAPWPAGPCKIVFLDFDGVLNCDQSMERLGCLGYLGSERLEKSFTADQREL
jgi:hypothetical protein